jgi:CheY-like chemotaxis protein
VFLNLLLNALQALPEGDPERNEVRVTVEAIAGGKVLVEIADNGAGMDPEVAARAFEPFFTTKGGAATGLGLSICRSVVASLGGEIKLDTEKGRGTRVRVLLPAGESRPAAADPADAETGRPAPRGPGRRVLVVDDDPIVGQAVRRLLRGNEVVLCSDSQRALDLLAGDSAFDVILCDLFMPGTNGMQLYRTLKERDPDAAARITFMSAGAYTAETSEFLDAVPNERVEKPFDAARLRALVARAPKRS